MNSKYWIVRRPIGIPRFRLYCFCYAGGSAASFLDWQAAVGPSVEICPLQLPGRGARFHEAPYTVFSELIADMSDVIERETKLPFAFFGHSMGGLLAFELARHNMKHGRELPTHLFISGCEAAKYRTSQEKLHLLSDRAFLKHLEKYNGTPPEVLAHPELMKLVLPTVRADFSLVEEYQYTPSPPLNVPVTVLAGRDEVFDSPKKISGWKEETRNACRIEWFEGGHFFIHSSRQAVIECIRAELMPYLDEQTSLLVQYG
jgi:medium-chain acyl-[acyl-carrier-protein] hydrolase